MNEQLYQPAAILVAALIGQRKGVTVESTIRLYSEVLAALDKEMATPGAAAVQRAPG
ncbi:MAG: hypothetical protein ABIO45_11180 [Burkholderiaceae bacterium]